RRSYNLKEKVPKILKDRLVINSDKFNKKNEWSRWNEINKNIKRKVGENPGLWLVNRKKILRIVSL
ncbi:MAG: transposase, partial [Clostridium sp.]|nr:transposase [Clostridium sp.]